MSETAMKQAKQWYHNPLTGKYRLFFDGEEPTGWKVGQGKHWYTNLDKNFSCYLTDELVPSGYVPGDFGRKLKTKTAKKYDSRIVR